MESSSAKEIKDIHVKIFQKISDLLTDDKFMANYNDFFFTSCQKFDEAEENKLEYTEIHGTFIKLLEDALESELMASFTDQEITEFYEVLRQNHKQFETMNESIYQTLWSFIDFNWFKQGMFKYKKMAK